MSHQCQITAAIDNLEESTFFAAVSYERRPIWHHAVSRECLRNAIIKIQEQFPFQILAIVLLPDHLHTIWQLPVNDANYSTRWRRLKEEFTRRYESLGPRESPTNPSRLRHRERNVWQRRFWEHTCRDEDDVKRCLDYVHWNPVKHGLSKSVRDYPWSSFHRYVAMGEYPANWGGTDPWPAYDEPEWE